MQHQKAFPMTTNEKFSRMFYTPEHYDLIRKRGLLGPNGWLLFVACNAAVDFARDVKKEYEAMLVENNSETTGIPIIGDREAPITAVFSDTETCPRLPKYVNGAHAVVFQCCHETVTGNTVNENIQQMIQVVRTLRAHRARTITVVTPYSPYSRQDKPTFMKREATLAKLFADQLKMAGATVHMAYHPHSYAIAGFYEPEMTFVALSGLALFVEMFEDKIGRDDVVVVSTDAGGAKFTVHYANAMKTTYAITNKFRKGPTANLLGVIGDIENKKTAIIIDDETATGTSILNAVTKLYEKYGIKEIYVALSHMKIKAEHLPRFIEAHEKCGLREVHTTDTIPQSPEILNTGFVKVHSIARRFASAINRIHYNQSVSMLFQDREG